MIYLSDCEYEQTDCEYEQTLLWSLVRGAVDRAEQSLGTELEFDIFHVLDGREVRFFYT